MTQLSTDLPCGPKAIEEYLAARAAGERSPGLARRKYAHQDEALAARRKQDRQRKARTVRTENK